MNPPGEIGGNHKNLSLQAVKRAEFPTDYITNTRRGLALHQTT